MKVKIIDFGYENAPLRAHDNDAGADVYAMQGKFIYPHETIKMPLGFGLELPDGYAAFVCPRSGLSSKGITTELSPVDSGYRGEIHAIITNNSSDIYTIERGDRVGQLVVVPVAICDFVAERGTERGENGFGSTGN